MTFHPLEGPGRTTAALRWTAAGMLVLAAHAVAGWWVLRHPISNVTPPELAQGITIDLEPIAVPQNAPEPSQTLASGTAAAPQAAATPEPPPVPAEAPPAPEPLPPTQPELPSPDPAPAPEPPPPSVEEPKPAPLPPPEQPPVSMPATTAPSEAVLAAPPPSPPRPMQPPKPKPKPQPPKPDPRRVAREMAERKERAERREQQRAARDEARAQTQARQERDAGGQSTQAATPSSASSGAAVASWRGQVVAHLNGFKPASPSGTGGTVRVAFSVDRNGRVLSASLAGSSGDGALDEAAVAMVRRASPVPAPPAELGGRVSLAVPVRFR